MEVLHRPVFFEKSDTGYEMLADVEYITFPCRKIG
jgi:hypothetical protein